MKTYILAKTRRGQEFLYTGHNSVQYPKTWDSKTVQKTIEALNKQFKLGREETYFAYIIDQYSNIPPTYKVYIRQGRMTLRRL